MSSFETKRVNKTSKTRVNHSSSTGKAGSRSAAQFHMGDPSPTLNSSDTENN